MLLGTASGAQAAVWKALTNKFTIALSKCTEQRAQGSVPAIPQAMVWAIEKQFGLVGVTIHNYKTIAKEKTSSIQLIQNISEKTDVTLDNSWQWLLHRPAGSDNHDADHRPFR